MSHYQGSVPDPEPARKWMELTACHGRNDEMFPGDIAAEIEHAKGICRTCSVWLECLEDALSTGDNQHGIRGGLKPSERRALARKRAQTAGTVAPPELKKPKESPPKTLAEAYGRRVSRTPDGHVLWHGAPHLKFQGAKYTALQAAFAVGHGRDPEGPVRRTCGKSCFRADHLTDGTIRDSEATCGTRPGYQRHKKHGERACDACRQANTDADNRLRRTGTTKEFVS